MSLSLLPSLAQNGTFSVGSGEGLCNIFYGTFHSSTASDCVNAVSSLPEGSASTKYVVNRVWESEHNLPLKVQRGRLLVSPGLLDNVKAPLRRMYDPSGSCRPSLSHNHGHRTQRHPQDGRSSATPMSHKFVSLWRLPDDGSPATERLGRWTR